MSKPRPEVREAVLKVQSVKIHRLEHYTNYEDAPPGAMSLGMQIDECLGIHRERGEIPTKIVLDLNPAQPPRPEDMD